VGSLKEMHGSGPKGDNAFLESSCIQTNNLQHRGKKKIIK